MKSIPHALPLAMVCALLGATALVPVAYAQTTGGSTTEISPSTSSQDTTSRREWRSSRDDDERYGAAGARDSANRSYAEEEDDVDQDGTSARRGSGMSRGMSGGMMDPDMMRMHMRMMRAHHSGDGNRGARLRLKRGDSSIDIRCPARENIATCVDAVGKLMDRLQATTTSPTRP